MMNKKALITGVLGQDGIFLSRLLASKGYSVLGTYSGRAPNNLRNLQFLPLETKLFEVDNNTTNNLEQILRQEKPDELYNLSALSSVRASFDDPILTKKLNETNPISILNFLAIELPETKFYQAGSSEMFGIPKVSPQNELTQFDPRSPYAVSKVNAFNQVTRSREGGLFAVNGIMYNHESEYRPDTFVSRKISKNIARILLKKQEKFSLGELSMIRDWGYAGDYVSAMWLMLQQENPKDYVVATGYARTLSEFVLEALDIAGLEKNLDKWVSADPEMFRKNEITNLMGDPSKARADLGWEPATSFRTWVTKMIENDYELESKSDA
jgi:GDPmannose 4,6-dehydratase